VPALVGSVEAERDGCVELASGYGVRDVEVLEGGGEDASFEGELSVAGEGSNGVAAGLSGAVSVTDADRLTPSSTIEAVKSPPSDPSPTDSVVG